MQRRTFIKSTSISVVAVQLPSWEILSPTSINKGNQSSPESLGIDSQAILDFLSAANASGIQWHNYVLMRHGKIASQGSWKPFNLNNKHTLYSLSKSFTSTAIGMLVDDGKLKVSDKVIDFFKEDLPPSISDNLRKMALHHLLTMNTGHTTECIDKFRTSQDKWSKIFLQHEVTYEPGSSFLYNTPATYMCGAIVHKVTGQTLTEFLKPRLFDKMGIKDYDWEVNKEGLNMGGWGLRLNPLDIAKFGQLYLQKGMWNGNQIISEKWVTEATKKQTTSQKGDSDWSQGYGYQFWRCKHNLYRGDGAFGQYCIVMPDQDAVLVVNSETGDMGKNLSIIYDTLLKGMQTIPLMENNALLKTLREAESKLGIAPSKNISTGPLPTSIVLLCSENPYQLNKVVINSNQKGHQFTFHTSKSITKIKSGKFSWVLNESSEASYLFGTSRRNPQPSDIAATSTMIGLNELQLELKFIEAIHGDKLIFKIDGDNSSLTFKSSLSEITNNTPEERMPIKARKA